jgi:hypothetical protein
MYYLYNNKLKLLCFIFVLQFEHPWILHLFLHAHLYTKLSFFIVEESFTSCYQKLYNHCSIACEGTHKLLVTHEPQATHNMHVW